MSVFLFVPLFESTVANRPALFSYTIDILSHIQLCMFYGMKLISAAMTLLVDKSESIW